MLQKSCLRDLLGEENQLEVLRTFMLKRGLHWPQPTPVAGTPDPLLVLLDLSLNWLLGLWFRVRLESSIVNGSRQLNIHLEPGIVDDGWLHFLVNVRQDKAHTFDAYQQVRLHGRPGWELHQGVYA